MEVALYQGRLEETVEIRTHELSATNEELHKTNDELTKALAEVRTLSGMLPICSYCKKIRDDKGYWNQLESYLRDHSEAEFSHGICPDCLKENFPDIYEKDLKKLRGEKAMVLFSPDCYAFAILQTTEPFSA
jgi:hypothetical protein